MNNTFLPVNFLRPRSFCWCNCWGSGCYCSSCSVLCCICSSVFMQEKAACVYWIVILYTSDFILDALVQSKPQLTLKSSHRLALATLNALKCFIIHIHSLYIHLMHHCCMHCVCSYSLTGLPHNHSKMNAVGFRELITHLCLGCLNCITFPYHPCIESLLSLYIVSHNIERDAKGENCCKFHVLSAIDS